MRKGRIIDGGVDLDEFDVVAEVFLNGVKQRVIGGGIVKFLVSSADDADRAQRQEDSDRPGTQVDFLSQNFAEPGAFLRRRAHQRDLRIMLVKGSAFEVCRDRFGAVEIDHIEAARRYNGRNSGARGGFEAGRASA